MYAFEHLPGPVSAELLELDPSYMVAGPVFINAGPQLPPVASSAFAVAIVEVSPKLRMVCPTGTSHAGLLLQFVHMGC